MLWSIPSGSSPSSLITLTDSPLINWWLSVKVKILEVILLIPILFLPTVVVLMELTSFAPVPWVSGRIILDFLVTGVPLILKIAFRSSFFAAPSL